MSNNEGINNGVSMISNFYSNLKENNMIYIGLFIIILLCILTIYFLYSMIGNYLFLKVVKTVPETTVPVICTKSSVFDAKFPEMGNGTRRTYTFWIYIYDITKNSGNYKTVAAVSNEKDYSSTSSTVYRTASPHIFLDKYNNKLYCHFNDKKINTDIKSFNNVTEKNIDNYMKSGITIDYIPLQRWVHVAIVVNSDSFSTAIYSYVDGDLVKSERDGGSNNNMFNNIDLNQNNYLLVGGDVTNIKNGPGFSGLISNFSCYNYELNQNDISNIYRQGPVNGFLAYLGLGMYGVRNPIYKI